jgi:hypothetical protein
MRALSFRERMREEAARSAAVQRADPWRLTLERVHGKVDFYDGLERISSQTLLVMVELEWTAVRVRGLTRGGYLEQVRGYCRQPLRRVS